MTHLTNAEEAKSEMRSRNYQQERKKKEQSRKARQQEKQQRRSPSRPVTGGDIAEPKTPDVGGSG